MSACDRVNLIIHRMTHLYQHLLHLHQSETELLLGPFVVWHFSSLHDKRVTATMLDTARAMLGGAPLSQSQIDGIAFSAALRVSKIWHVYLDHIDSAAKALQFGLYSGALMDLHAQLIVHTKDNPLIRIHDVYRKGWAPEQLTVADIFCPDNGILTLDGAESVWAEHIDDTTRCGSGKPRQPPPRLRGVNRNHTLVKDPTQSRGRAPCLNALFDNAEFKSALPVWIKGLPAVSSIRYISTTLRKALFEEATSGPLHAMAVQFLLGAYSHARYIAPPSVRMQLYKTKTIALDTPFEVTIGMMSPQEVYILISEFLVVAAERHAGLWRVLAKDPGWKRYVDQAMTHADGYLRKSMYAAHYKVSVCGRIPTKAVYFERKMTHSRVFSLLQAALKIKASIPSKIINSLKRDELSRVYKCLRKQPEGIRVYESILLEAGMSPLSLQTLQGCLATIQTSHAKRSLSKCVGSWSQCDKNIFYMYVHFLTHRSKLRMVPVVANPPPKGHEHTTERLPILLVCTNCFTVRSPRRGSMAPKTSQEGTTLNTIDFGLTCTGCLSSNHIRCISLNRFKVWGLCVGGNENPTLITACRMCNVPTDSEYVVGDTELCTLCFRRAQRSMVPVSCICGLRFTTKFPCATTFLATEARKIGLFALCTKHKHVKAHAVSPYLDIGFYRALLPTRR